MSFKANISEKSFSTSLGSVRYWVANHHDGSLPQLVFIPGLTADHTLFDAQMSYFAGKANCLVWDAPAHGLSRPYPLHFTMDDYACILHDILHVEGFARPVLIGQSLGGYVSQAFMDLFPGEAIGFISVDSAPLKKRYMKNWEIWALRHTFLMYLSIPWKVLIAWGSSGVATTEAGKQNMRTMMESYGKREYCELAAYGYRMLADAVDANRPYEIDCPVLLLCGERDQAASTRRYNKTWAAEENLPITWIPDAGHNSTIDAPDFVNEQIDSFISHLLGNENQDRRA